MFNLEERIPARHLLRRINPVAARVPGDLRGKLQPFYSETGRPSTDPGLMMRMLMAGCCYGIRFERKLCEEAGLNLAIAGSAAPVPMIRCLIIRRSVNRHGRFRDSGIFRQLSEAAVKACMDAGPVKGEGFAIDAGVMEADASRYHGQAPGESDWPAPERQTRAAAGFLSGPGGEDPSGDRKLPKVIPPADPCSARTAKANKRVQFGYGLNYMIDAGHAVIAGAEATPARTYDEAAATRTMIDRTEKVSGAKPERRAADTAYGTGKMLAWLLDKGITPHIPVWERCQRTDGMFSRPGFTCGAGRGLYLCPDGKALRTPGTIHDGRVRNYLPRARECRVCNLKERCTRAPFRKIVRDISGDARDYARSLKRTPEFEQSRNERKKAEMRFAHLKVHHRFGRMRLRGLTGARGEFRLAAIVQNLKTPANCVWRPPRVSQRGAANLSAPA